MTISDVRRNASYVLDAKPEEFRRMELNLMNVSNLVGLYYPTPRIGGGYYVDGAERHLGQQLPLPPNHLRHWYGLKDGQYLDEWYLSSGKRDVDQMRRIVTRDGFDLVEGPILEFGCSAARMLRHLLQETQTTECWGVDIHAEAIHWAQSHFQPPFNFVLNTTTPHLMFEDNYFNLVYAGSVFTHLGEMDNAWLLELRRIVRPGGRLFLTVSDEHTLAEIKRIQPGHASVKTDADFAAASGVFEKSWVQFVTGTTPWLQRNVYNRKAWLPRLEQWFLVVAYEEDAYGWQSAVLLEKRRKR